MINKENIKDVSGYMNSPVRVKDYNHQGTFYKTIDKKNGNLISLRSQGKAHYYWQLFFDDSVKEIYTQFPLDLKLTTKLAKQFGIRHPQNKKTTMTTDFLVIYTDGHIEAHSLRDSKRTFEKDRAVEIQFLEKTYWESKGILFKLVFKEDLNLRFTTNIRVCAMFWDIKDVFDEASFIKHLIIQKHISVDLESDLLDIRVIKKDYQEEINIWEKELLPRRLAML